MAETYDVVADIVCDSHHCDHLCGSTLQDTPFPTYKDEFQTLLLYQIHDLLLVVTSDSIHKYTLRRRVIMQQPIPRVYTLPRPSWPFCGVCRRNEGAPLTRCVNCRRYSHQVCRAIPINPIYKVAQCQDCKVVLEADNGPPIQPSTASQPLLHPQPQPLPLPQSLFKEWQGQPYPFNPTNTANNPRPQQSPPLSPRSHAPARELLLTQPWPNDETPIAGPLINPYATTVNPALLNAHSDLHTQAGQPGFEARRLARKIEYMDIMQRQNQQQNQR